MTQGNPVIPFLVEGDQDVAILTFFQEKSVIGNKYQIKNMEGKNNILPELRTLIKLDTNKVCVIKDIDRIQENLVVDKPEDANADKKSKTELAKERFGNQFEEKKIIKDEENLIILQIRNTQITFIAAGLENDDDMRKWGILKYAMDDYIFKMILKESKGISLDYTNASVGLEKLKKMKEVASRNKITFDKSKRFLEVFKGITGPAVSPAEFYDRILRKVNLENCKEVFSPILKWL